MIKSEREKTRVVRKEKVLAMFSDGNTLYTNTVAKKIGVVWPVADRLLQQLVDEGRLSGNKLDGYSLYKEPASRTRWGRVKNFFRPDLVLAPRKDYDR